MRETDGHHLNLKCGCLGDYALLCPQILTLDILARKPLPKLHGRGWRPPQARALSFRVPDSRYTMSNFSFLGLFLQAHPVVQFVMLGLVLASVWCWSIVIEKTFAFSRARTQTDEFERIFWSGKSLDELYQGVSQKPASAVQALFVAAMREWRRSIEGTAKPLAGVQMRIERVMEVTITREMERLERRLLFLATVGAVAPFVGLFGTVWGIMTAFQGIAASKNTNLAVVAPGIAEALFATALGLLAAIPAVIFYNAFSQSATRIAQRLEAFADEFSAIVSRQLDLKT